MKFPKLSSKAILAPMAGVTDVAFRALARKYGAGLTYTEFVSSAAIVRNNKTTKRMTLTDPSEKIKAVQIFGNNQDELVQAAKILAKDFDIIDLNCGCPAYKVLKIGAGSELLKKPEIIGSIVEKLVKATNKIITVKIRSGIDEKHINAIKVAKVAENAGASAVTVHGRTVKQGYSNTADWDLIKKVKESLNIPVIGNGDINSPEAFKEKLEESGVDYMMIGRAAMINPYIFKQISDYIKTGKYKSPDKLESFFEYMKLAKKYNIPYNSIKHHAIKFTKGIDSGSAIRIKMSQCKDIDSLKKILKNL
jgi:tRNA-dihydrouridine synthase B